MRRALSICLACLLLWVSAPSAKASALIVYRHAGSGTQMRIALTFDDGPHPRYTPVILDILAEYGVSATFFAVGENAALYPQLLQRAAAEGHEIANHTYHHYHVGDLEGKQLATEITDCSRLLERITDKHVQYFRPPEGVCSDAVKCFCRENELTIILWSVDTRDWAHTEVSEIVKNVRENTKNGSIILMHDFIGKNSPTPAALRRIIPMLQESGYEFVTVSQLLEG